MAAATRKTRKQVAENVGGIPSRGETPKEKGGFRLWFETMTLGQTGAYLRLLRWCLFDSLVMSVPYAVLIAAVYFFIVPIAHPGQPLPTEALLCLAGILALQAIGYLFVRRKSYIDFSIGFVESTKASRIQMGEHLRTLSMGFYNERDPGDLSTVLLRDYTEIETFAQQLLPQIATILIRFVLAIAVLSLFDVRMMLATFIVVPLALPFAFLSARRMATESEHLQSSQQHAAEGVLEYVGGIRTLQAFDMTGERFDALRTSLAAQHDAAVGLETHAAAPVSMVGRFVLHCGIAIVMLYGGVLVTNGSLHPFYYLVFLLLSLDLYGPVLALFTFIADFARTTHSGRRIRGLFATQPLPEATPDCARAPSCVDIVFDDVSFGYGSNQVLKQVDIAFPARSVTALVGPSGSGKSTITRLIARFWDVESGEIRMGGVPLPAIPSSELFERISMVFQDVYLFHDTIEGNIRMGRPDATHEDVVAAAKKAACHDFIESLADGYQTMVGEGGSTLSGGEKQRISIARALLKDAPVVLLDEATSSLDPENEVLIQQAISALVEDKTVVVIAHRLQSICNADQIVVLDGGRVVQSGTHEGLLAQDGAYARLWNEQENARSWQMGGAGTGDGEKGRQSPSAPAMQTGGADTGDEERG